MNYEDNIKKKIGKDHGFKTPEGFLEPVYKQVMNTLPERKPFKVPQRTVWQRMRPYLYLTAMFLGLWATMKIVAQLQVAPQETISLDNPPALVAQALSTPDVTNQIDLSQDVSDLAIAGDIAANYDSFEDFEKDFDYEFTAQVDGIDVEALQQNISSDNQSNDQVADTDDDFYYDYYYALL